MKLAELHGVNSSVIDEGLFGQLLSGTAMRAKAGLIQIPDTPFAHKSDLERLVAQAERLPGSLFDPNNAGWWTNLTRAFGQGWIHPTTGKAIRTPEAMAAKIKDTVRAEAGQWVSHAGELQQQHADDANFKRSLGGMERNLQRRQQILSLIQQYGADPAEFGFKQAKQPKTKKPKGKKDKRNQYNDMAKTMHMITRLLTQEEKTAMVSALAEAADDGGMFGRLSDFVNQNKGSLGSILDLVNPNRRAAMGNQYVRQSQNRLVALIAINAAHKLAMHVQDVLGSKAHP